MRDRSIVLWVVLGAVLLVVLNLPASVSGQAKAALREGVAPAAGRALRLLPLDRGERPVRPGLRRPAPREPADGRRTGPPAERGPRLAGARAGERRTAGQLQFAAPPGRRLIPCEVIARDITGWWQTLRLSKGAERRGRDRTWRWSRPTGWSARRWTSRRARRCPADFRPGLQGLRAHRRGPARSASSRAAALPRPGQAVCRMEFINKNVPVLRRRRGGDLRPGRRVPEGSADRLRGEGAHRTRRGSSSAPT